MRAPTISEVAKTAGVSVATVSRVVNGSPSVSHETQARVQEAIERLGYQPNVWGRSLRRGESRVVLVIVPNVSNPYYAPIIAGTEDRLHEDGYSGMLCITNAEAERRALYLEFLKDGRADGAILMEPARDDPHVTGMARHYHLVQCSEYCDNQAVSHVSVDNLAAAREVVLTLAGLGHRRIGFVGADNDFMSTIARRQGYLDGLRVLNIPRGRTTRPLPDGITALPPAWRPPGRLLGPGRSAHGPVLHLRRAGPGAVQAAGSWASGCRRTCRWWGLTMWSTP